MELLEDYLKYLTTEYSSVSEIWLYGSRANEAETATSDWDLIAFANNADFEKMKKDPNVRQHKFDLLVSCNCDRIEQPWIEVNKRPKALHLNSIYELNWKQTSESTAEYSDSKQRRRMARRIFQKGH
jgi:predicted nucleotidyltransferase